MTFRGAPTWRRVLGTSILSVSLATGGVVTSYAPRASAQSAADLAKARTEFKEGVSLEAAGNWAAALAKFQDVARIKTTPQVRYHIGRCKENLGRLNEALGEYRLAEYEAQQSKAKELPEIEKAREQLEARVPKVIIQRGEGAKNAKVEIDGVALGEAQIGKEFAVDPGSHKISAKIDRGQWDQTVEVAEGETKSVELVPPDDLKGAALPPDDTPPDDTPPDDGSVKLDTKKGAGALPWIVGGVGIVALGAGAFFGLQAKKKEDDLNASCRGGVCPNSKKSLEDESKQAALISNIGFGVGIACVGTAIVLLAVGGGKSEKKASKQKRIHLVPTADARGVSVLGNF
jgi:hypothetical protein